MDVHALRTWGIAVTGALMVAALAVAVQPGDVVAQAPPQTVLAQAQAEPLAFIVRFRGSGPIARAQMQAARGEMQAAQRNVEQQLTRQTAFVGLCFDRFTVGGAEMVLRTCDSVAANARASVQQTWLMRLRAMRAVEYVDANATASQGRAG